MRDCKWADYPILNCIVGKADGYQLAKDTALRFDIHLKVGAVCTLARKTSNDTELLDWIAFARSSLGDHQVITTFFDHITTKFKDMDMSRLICPWFILRPSNIDPLGHIWQGIVQDRVFEWEHAFHLVVELDGKELIHMISRIMHSFCYWIAHCEKQPADQMGQLRMLYANAMNVDFFIVTDHAKYVKIDLHHFSGRLITDAFIAPWIAFNMLHVTGDKDIVTGGNNHGNGVLKAVVASLFDVDEPQDAAVVVTLEQVKALGWDDLVRAMKARC